MTMKPTEEVIHLLKAARTGDARARERVMSLVYDELHGIATNALRRERAGHTLQATALVHEAYLKLVDQKHANWQAQTQFFAVAARCMRRILIDHARRRLAQKHGGNLERVSLAQELSAVATNPEKWIDLDEAMTKLAAFFAPRKARVVELRFFAGLENREIAEALSISDATVERDWAFARAWLQREMSA